MSGANFLEKLLDGVEVEWKTLEYVATKISSGGTPKTGVAEYYDGDIPWLRTQEVDFGEIWDCSGQVFPYPLTECLYRLCSNRA